MKLLTVRIDDELHKQFKQYVLTNDTTMSDIIIKHIENEVEESYEEETDRE